MSYRDKDGPKPALSEFAAAKSVFGLALVAIALLVWALISFFS
jgi:hypothetical protein